MAQPADNRQSRVETARETLDILNHGSYTNRHGEVCELRQMQDNAVSRSILYAPDTPVSTLEATTDAVAREITVTPQTTLGAARQLLEEGESRVLCLNFASAKNPGGGFQSGSQAQEESLARASGLYGCIAQMQQMYQYNRAGKSCLYSDYMIYSPAVPVFRDDNDNLLDKPVPVSFITAPAVNAGVVREREPHNIPNIAPVMLKRIEKILLVAAEHGHEILVLGAYGCGVFRNDPVEVAEWFRTHIEGSFNNAFRKIVFAVYDTSRSQSVIAAFQRAFGRMD